MKLSAARVFVSDLALCASFYERALGLQVRAGGAGAGYVVFEAGGVELIIESVAQDASAEEQALVGRFTGLSFAVTGIEAVCAALHNNGVVITGQPERQTWGGVLATVQDPSGNELQLVEYPSAP
jgi:predicted enzyme related to lactoylglutathione lyase